MKECDHIREFVLTDYLDGNFDKMLADHVETHLLDCRDCRVFFKKVNDNTALPFRKSLPLPVPGELWSAIKQNIEKEVQVKIPMADFMDALRGLFVFPRIIPVFVSLILVLVVGSVTLDTMQIHQAQSKEQGTYLVSLLSATESSQGESNELGTPLEHYFL